MALPLRSWLSLPRGAAARGARWASSAAKAALIESELSPSGVLTLAYRRATIIVPMIARARRLKALTWVGGEGCV